YFSALTISSARAGWSQTTASCPARRKARESDASVLASSSTMSRVAFMVLFSEIPSAARDPYRLKYLRFAYKTALLQFLKRSLVLIVVPLHFLGYNDPSACGVRDFGKKWPRAERGIPIA